MIEGWDKISPSPSVYERMVPAGRALIIYRPDPMARERGDWILLSIFRGLIVGQQGILANYKEFVEAGPEREAFIKAAAWAERAHELPAIEVSWYAQELTPGLLCYGKTRKGWSARCQLVEKMTGTYYQDHPAWLVKGDDFKAPANILYEHEIDPGRFVLRPADGTWSHDFNDRRQIGDYFRGMQAQAGHTTIVFRDVIALQQLFYELPAAVIAMLKLMNGDVQGEDHG